jgi:hypothetical protein
MSLLNNLYNYYVVIGKIEKGKEKSIIPLGTVEGFGVGENAKIFAIEYTESLVASLHASKLTKDTSDIKLLIMQDTSLPEGDGGIILDSCEFNCGDGLRHLGKVGLTLYKIKRTSVSI